MHLSSSETRLQYNRIVPFNVWITDYMTWWRIICCLEARWSCFAVILGSYPLLFLMAVSPIKQIPVSRAPTSGKTFNISACPSICGFTTLAHTPLMKYLVLVSLILTPENCKLMCHLVLRYNIARQMISPQPQISIQSCGFIDTPVSKISHNSIVGTLWLIIRLKSALPHPSIWTLTQSIDSLWNISMINNIIQHQLI